MDDKNELNDLLLGNQKESSSSKKFFLIAAGILLLFFIIIGIMKFVGSNETKQPLPITASEQVKKPLPPASAMPSGVNASTPAADANAGASQDEKLNAIVKKLQQDAQQQASSGGATQPVVTPSAPVAKVEQKPVVATQSVPVVVKPASSPVQAPAVKPTAVPIKTVAEQPKQAVKAKENNTTKDVKTAFKDATKNVVKQKPAVKAEPKVLPAKKADVNTAAVATGTYYIQVGYFANEASAKGLKDKVNSIGLGSTTKNAVKGDKNITKVWAGPFGSKEEAQKALPKVREQIKNDAFIIKG